MATTAPPTGWYLARIRWLIECWKLDAPAPDATVPATFSSCWQVAISKYRYYAPAQTGRHWDWVRGVMPVPVGVPTTSESSNLLHRDRRQFHGVRIRHVLIAPTRSVAAVRWYISKQANLLDVRVTTQSSTLNVPSSVLSILPNGSTADRRTTSHNIDSVL